MPLPSLVPNGVISEFDVLQVVGNKSHIDLGVCVDLCVPSFILGCPFPLWLDDGIVIEYCRSSNFEVI